jgi:hypothetical protein
MLYEPLIEITRLNELESGGFTDGDAIKEVLAVRRDSFVSDVDRLLGVLRYYGSRIAQIERLRDECQTEITRCKSRRESLKTFVGECMIQFPNEKFVGNSGKFTRQKNGGKTPVTTNIFLGKISLSNVISFEDTERVPQKYLKRVENFTVDLDAVRADLELGVDVPGFELGERGTHIRDSV